MIGSGMPSIQRRSPRPMVILPMRLNCRRINTEARILFVLPFKVPMWNPFVGAGVFLQQPGMETNVDKEHVKGAADKAKGSIKKGVGKATGNERLRREGEIDKAKGDLHKAAGDAKDAAKRFTR